MMTFDCVEEVEKIARIHPGAQLVLRIAVEVTDAPCPMSIKFGAPRETWEENVEACKKHNMRLRGVSFHVGTGGCSFAAYENSIINAKQIF
jgi:ornithine decarboxylase